MKITQIAALIVLFSFVSSLYAESNVTIRDFRKYGFDYGYEEWKDLGSVQSRSDTGTHLKGGAKGGAGAFFSEILDLASSAQIDVKIKRGPENTEETLHLKLVSADNKSYGWQISLKDLPDKEFKSVKLDLAPAAGKLDLEAIKQLQVQGTFNPMAKVDVEIESIVATGTAAAPAK